MVEDVSAPSRHERPRDKSFSTGRLSFGVETVLGDPDEGGVQPSHPEDDEEHGELASCLNVDVVSFTSETLDNAGIGIGRMIWVFWRIWAK